MPRDINVGITRGEDRIGNQTSNFNLVLLILFSNFLNRFRKITATRSPSRLLTSILQESHLKDSDRWPGQELELNSLLGSNVSKVFGVRDKAFSGFLSDGFGALAA